MACSVHSDRYRSTKADFYEKPHTAIIAFNWESMNQGLTAKKLYWQSKQIKANVVFVLESLFAEKAICLDMICCSAIVYFSRIGVTRG